MTSINKLKKSIKQKGGKQAMDAIDSKKTTVEKKTVEKGTKKMRLPFLRKIHVKPVYIVLGVVVTILAVFFLRVAVWEHNYLAAMEGSERDVATIGVTNEGGEAEEIDETEPTEQERIDWCANAQPNQPCSFSIPVLGIYDARIVEVGLRGQGEMATPVNIYDVGWYTGSGSVLPGTSGVTVMNAHGGDLGYGIFRSLPKLAVGGEIKVKMGNGTVYTYVVAESVRKNLGDEANEYMKTAFTGLSGARNTLTLITCTGDWWESQQTYSQRLFVRAALQ